tara:strand:- start:3471 stop:6431 length:2961 start_codon:yes stop_codon:yes gene_type:complete
MTKILLAERKRRPTQNIMNRVRSNYGAQSSRAAAELGVEREIVESIIAAECDGRPPYPNGQLRVRFEYHLFSKSGYNHNNRKSLPWGASGHRWDSINKAAKVSKWAAYACTSFGPYQLMGWHYKTLGYKSPMAMVEAFQNGGLTEQTNAFIKFIRNYRGGQIHTAIKKSPPDWGTAGLRYNGVRRYGDYMKAAYDLAKKAPGGSSLAAGSMASLVPGAVTPKAAVGKKPTLDKKSIVVASDNVKNIKHLSPGKTPNIEIAKDSQGQYTISYTGSDPLNGNITFDNRNLDKEVNRLFGYNSWNEYSKSNKSIDGNPSVHALHVGYALEEFKANFDPNDYVLVGVPKNNLTPTSFKIKLISGLRKGLFGDDKGTVSLSRLGILNSAMYAPKDGLANVDVVDRAKEKTGILPLVTSVKSSNMPVEHPDGNYWNSSFKPQTTNSISDALTINPSEEKSVAQLLKEVAEMTEEQLQEQLISEFFDLQTGLNKLSSLGAGAGEAAKNAGRAAKRQLKNAVNSVGRTLSKAGRRAFKIKMLKLRNITTATSLATMKGIGAAITGIGAVGGAVIAWNMLPDDADIVDVIMYLVLGSGIGAGITSLGLFLLKMLLLKVLGFVVVAAKTAALVVTASVVALALRMLYLYVTDKAAFNVLFRKIKSGLNYAWQSLKRQVGLSTDISLEEYLKIADQDKDLTEKMIALAGGEKVTQKTSEASSSNDLEYFLLPKNWRNGVYYTKAEGILAQRVGANLQTGLVVTDKGEFRKDQLIKFNKAALGAVGLKGSATGKPTQFATSKRKIVSVKGGNALIFGHSQSGPTSMGGALEDILKSSGKKITRITINGANDEKLAASLDRIPKNKYNQAFLFLNGNIYRERSKKPEALQVSSKSQIINFMLQQLGIPKQNIVIVLPPVNTDSKKSLSRAGLIKKARSLFERSGFKVATVIVSGQDSFSDSIHIKGSDAQVQSSMRNIAGQKLFETLLAYKTDLRREIA